ncbi:MAG: iron ABC transporter permease [Candidatus Methanoplasma sp.]|jgi:ABC-type Fe3+-siderophore transport system permease subunit|nr:iron ABC transporter permease [Candidatus Methanoplasma sp.]
MADNSLLRKEYSKAVGRKFLFISVCASLTVLAFGLTLTVGFFDIGIAETFSVLLDHMTGNISDAQVDYIMWEIRLPEAIMAVSVGAALSAGGAVMQTMLRNPLADPYTMGISAGASLGASISIILGFSIIPGLAGGVSTIMNAFVLALVPIFIILAISRKMAVTPTKMILSGIAVMFVFSAFTSLLMVTASSQSLADVYAWRVGTLSRSGWEAIPLVTAITAAGILALMSQYRKYNVLTAGEKCATALGVDPKRIMLTGMVIVAIMTATAVSFTGTIGFIGLVGPHIARVFVGSESKYLIPASSAFGALFLLCADTVAKVSGDLGLPVGVICALVGCPIFVLILIKMKKNVWR